MVDHRQTPRYQELPQVPGGGPRCAWGVFGDDDRVGALQRIDENTILDAAAHIRTGHVFSLNWRLDRPSPAILTRQSVRHTLIRQDVGFDDRYDRFYPQASSQWDALCHVEHPLHGFYNNHSRADIDGSGGNQLGIDRWASRGIASRFVLADIGRARARHGEPLDCAARTAVDTVQIQTVLDEQDVELREGDILLLRFGWIDWYERLSVPKREELARADLFPAPGLAPDEATAEWLWDRGVAAVASDTPALEAMPFNKESEHGFLHFRLIPLLGLAVGELFDLEALATSCAADGNFEGFLTAAPLNMPGGSGSPANALAIK